MANYVERVAERATKVQVLKVLLSVLAVPFYVLGFVAAVVFVLARWCIAAVIVGFGDVAKRGADDVG